MSTETEAILDGVRAWADENEVAVDSVEDSEIVVTLPGEKKLKTNVAISIFARTAHLQAFVIRHPDENAAEFNRWLLQKNLKPGPVTFAIDSLGDVYLRTSVPRDHLLDELDVLLGAMLAAADSSFNELLLIGFLTGMKKEWAWRVSRGESTRNLAAFEQVLSGEDNEFLAAGTGRPDGGSRADADSDSRTRVDGGAGTEAEHDSDSETRADSESGQRR